MNIIRLAKRFEKLAIDNSPAILTAFGIAGALTTAYLTGKSTVKAIRMIDDKTWEVNRDRGPNAGFRMLEPKEQIQLTWKLYILPATSAFFTIAAIYGANHVSTRRATAMAAAYSISEKAFSEYKDKVVEKLGDKKERDLREELAQERVNKNPVDEKSIIITDDGEVLCYDQYAGRYFKSGMEAIKTAANEINYLILHQGYASLTDFYHELGLSSTRLSDEVGWSTDQLLELDISTVLSKDNRPCIAIDFNHHPIRHFDKFIK